MAKILWSARVAKRKLAKAALEMAVAEMDSVVNGPRAWGTQSENDVARHLALHAAEQLRLSETGSW